MNENEKLWILMGLLIGFYGNWYFNLLSDVEINLLRYSDSANELMIITITSLSAFLLFFYCYEITKSDRKVFRGLPHSFYFAAFHLLTTQVLLFYISEDFIANPIRNIGCLLWFFIILREIEFRKKGQV